MSSIKKIEKLIFLFLALIFVGPFIATSFFTTIDGAAHVYNSQLLKSLLFENNFKIKSFFTLNSEIVPNLFDHVYLVILEFFVSSRIAEKIMILSYYFGICYSFRSLIKVIVPNNIEFSYFIFPFVYTFVFALGFYNFSFGVVFMLLSNRYFIIKNQQNSQSIKNFLILIILLLLTYYSHALTFIFTLLSISILSLKFFKLDQKVNSGIILQLKYKWKKFKFIIISATVPFTLFLLYYLSRTNTEEKTYLSFKELIYSIKTISPIIAYSFNEERNYTSKIFYTILIFSVLIIVFSLVKKSKSYYVVLKKILNSWFFLVVSMFVLYFIMPDSGHGGGFISIRILYVIFLFIIVWLASISSSKYLSIIIVIPILFWSSKLEEFHKKKIIKMNQIAEDCEKASNYIEKDAIVLPLKYSDNWLVGHFSNYIGYNKSVILLENYECSNNYFPVQWNVSSYPRLTLGQINISELNSDVFNGSTKNKAAIDYVFIVGNPDLSIDSNSNKMHKVILSKGKKIYQTPNCSLYKFEK